MQFLSRHYGLVAFCGVLALLLSVLDRKIDPYSRRFLQWADDRNLHKPLLLLLGLFYVTCFLLRPSYYADYHGGSLGDCYYYLRQAINNPSYYYPHHFFFAFVPMQLLKVATWLGFFDRADPFFFEKAYAFCSLPNRLMAGVGLLAAYALLRKLTRSRFACALGTFFLATTFGYWFWTRQCNGTGFLLPLIVCTLYALQDCLERRTPRSFVAAALLTCFCVYTHISSIHFVLSVAVVMTFICLRRAAHEKDRRAPLVHLASFYAICLGMGTLFYILTGIRFGFSSFSLIMMEMTHPELFGHFEFDRRFLEHLLKDPISVPLSLTLGLLQAHSKQTLLEIMAVVVELTSVFWVLFSLRHYDWRSFFKDERNSLIWFCGAGFLFCAVGFAMRTTWLQYYTPITPLAVFLFLGLAYSSRKDGPSHVPLFPVAGLVLGMLFINGLSQTSVLVNGHPKDLNVYRTLTSVREAAGTEEKVVYYGYEGQDWYNFDCVNGYYRMAPKFSHILWKKPRPLSEVLRGTYDKRVILLSAVDYPDVTAAKAAGYKPTLYRSTLPDTPDIYLLGKPISDRYR